MKLTTISVAAAAMVVFAQSAQAREHYRHHRYHVAHVARHYLSPRHGDVAAQNKFADHGQSDFSRNYSSQKYSEQSYPQRSAYGGQISSHIGGRPSAWCGWEMRQLVSGDPGPAFNLARNWAHWGQAGPAGVGAVVVWSHHVGKIVGQGGGEWHRVRQRRQSDSHPAALDRRRHRHSLGMIASLQIATLR